MRKPYFSSVTLLLVALCAACSPRATQPGGPSAAPGLPVLSAASFTSGEAFEALPPGDVLLTVDAGTLLNQTIPTALVGSPEEKAKFDKGLTELQDKAGIDPKQLKLVALSIRNITSGKPEVAGVMTGTFDTAKLTESLKKDPKTGEVAQEEAYNGQTLYVRKEKDGSEFAAAVLDAGTLVLGWPASRAREAVDAHAGKADNATKDATLFSAFKATDQAGVLRFAMKFPKDKISAEDIAKDPTAKSFAAVNYIAGSVNASSGLGIRLTAKTGSPADAQPLHDNIQKGLDMLKNAVSGSPDAKSVSDILSGTTLAVNGSDVDLTMNISAAQLATLGADVQKLGGSLFGGAMGGAPSSPDDDSAPKDDDDKN